MNPPFVQRLHAADTAHVLVTVSPCWWWHGLFSVEVLVFKSPLLYLTMAPRQKNNDAGNSDKPRRSRKVLPKWKCEYSTIRYFERQRDHIQITFITVYCDNYSILLLVVVNYFLVLSILSGICWGSWSISPTVPRERFQMTSSLVLGNDVYYMCVVYLWLKNWYICIWLS